MAEAGGSAGAGGDAGAGEAATSEADFLRGRLLIAMPDMPDPRFQRSLVYLCEHNAEGALGLVVNRPAEDLTIADLLGKLEIEIDDEDAGRERLGLGGPVEPGRGFVLHSADVRIPGSSLDVSDAVALTGTLDILRAIANGDGPRRRLVALGYAGWGPGQLEREFRENGWLACEADDALLFGEDAEGKWESALAKLGISPAILASGGRA
ncbi:MAG: YqgE/AlgH family protein [Pseudomonadota bacterium]